MFGASAVKNTAGNAISGILGILLLIVFFVLVDYLLNNLEWYIILLIVLSILITWFIIKKRNGRTKSNVQFSLINDHPFTYIKVTDLQGNFVVLQPHEVYCIFNDWKDVYRPYRTVFLTDFMTIPVEKAHDPKKAKQLKKKGLTFYLMIKQSGEHSFQSRSRIFLEQRDVLLLKDWVEEARRKNEFINSAFTH